MDLTPQEAAERLAAGDADLIDVREPYEFEAGHIEGARHVPLPDLAEFAPSDSTPTGRWSSSAAWAARSAMATEAFRRAGFDAYNLAGGVIAWERAGLPFTGAVADH